MSDSLLLLERVHKSYGSRAVLDLDGLELRAGSSYLLTGENGAGKSTLLRIIAGLEAARTSGARYRGQPVDFGNYPDWMRREVIYVHQQPYMFHSSVEDNIAYGLRARHVARSDRGPLLREAIAWAGVAHLLKLPAPKLSVGEKQRVALARARVLRPRLFLLDEPTANLDAESRSRTMALIRDLCESDGTAVVACHDREMAQLSGVVRLHLERGKITMGDLGDTRLAPVRFDEPDLSRRGNRHAIGDSRWRSAAND